MNKLSEGVGLIRPLPAKGFQIILAPKMTVVGGLAVNGTEQIEFTNDRLSLRIVWWGEPVADAVRFEIGFF